MSNDIHANNVTEQSVPTPRRLFFRNARLARQCCPPTDLPSDELTAQLKEGIKKYVSEDPRASAPRPAYA